jgi:hypothetical protein
MKRRQVIAGGTQQQLPFPSLKTNKRDSSAFIPAKTADSSKGLNFNLQNGAQRSTTPYRSVKRLQSIMKHSPCPTNYSFSKAIEVSKNMLDKLN